MKSLKQWTLCICVYLTTLSVYHTGVYIVYLPLVQTNRVVSNHVYKALYCHSPKSGLWSSSGYPITIIKPLCSIQIAQPNEPFLLQADAPGICLSAVLRQARGDREHLLLMQGSPQGKKSRVADMDACIVLAIYIYIYIIFFYSWGLI